MANFTTRVVLHDSDNYNGLHQAMVDEEFSRTIVDSETGKEYELPPAEYTKEEEHSIEHVLNSAKRAARTITENFSVLVTKSDGIWWYNLTEAPEKF